MEEVKQESETVSLPTSIQQLMNKCHAKTRFVILKPVEPGTLLFTKVIKLAVQCKLAAAFCAESMVMMGPHLVSIVAVPPAMHAHLDGWCTAIQTQLVPAEVHTTYARLVPKKHQKNFAVLMCADENPIPDLTTVQTLKTLTDERELVKNLHMDDKTFDVCFVTK